MQGKYSAIIISYWFADRNKIAVDTCGADSLSIMRLLKLLYYADGCYMAIHDEQLFYEDEYAWENGPVVREVWEKWQHNYDINIAEEERNKYQTEISKTDQSFLEDVFNSFGQYSAWELRNLTHQEAPWLQATLNGTNFHNKIDRNTVKAYFKENYVAQ